MEKELAQVRHDVDDTEVHAGLVSGGILGEKRRRPPPSFGGGHVTRTVNVDSRGLTDELKALATDAGYTVP